MFIPDFSESIQPLINRCEVKCWVFQDVVTQIEKYSLCSLFAKTQGSFLTFYFALGYRQLTQCCDSRWTVKGLSHAYTCIHSSPQTSFPSRVSHNTEQFTVLYNRSLLVFILNIAVCTRSSQIPYLFPSPPLTSFTQYDTPWVHSYCCKWHYFVLVL